MRVVLEGLVLAHAFHAAVSKSPLVVAVVHPQTII